MQRAFRRTTRGCRHRPADALVRFVDVQKTCGVQLVVKQLDLDIRRGEFLALLGPSGSGKTTMLITLARSTSSCARTCRSS